MHVLRSWLERQPTAMIVALGGLAVAVLGVADYLTSSELSLAIFYLAPILGAAWLSGRQVGYVLSLASAVVGVATDLWSGLQHTSILFHLWDGVMRLGFYVLAVALLDSLHRALDRERSMARRDALTGLSNRAAFFELATAEAGRSRRYGRPLTVAYLDCDHFKEVNDRSGHAVGDQLLVVLARELEASIRRTDHAARLGGDEFALLFPELDAAGAQEALTTLHGRLLGAMRSRGWPVTFSVGVVTYSCAPESISTALHRADELMYEVKRSGRNAVRFAAELDPAPAPAPLRAVARG